MAKKAAIKTDVNSESHAVKKPRFPRVAESDLSEYKPRTPFGKELMEIRKRIVASGEPLLGWDEIEKEVARLRGGHE